ncbi:MAG: hypothetical protein D6726_05135 [Nitrospirae bacterium]|nr:MAG: hypothetical protein D6726_05135 [Nitrospirota bacterium]
MSMVLVTLLLVVLAEGTEKAGGLNDAYMLIKGKRNYEALRVLEQIIPDEKEKPLYYFLKGLALKGVKHYRKSVDFLNRAYITAKDRRLRELSLYHRGLAYLLGGFYYEAASNFRLFQREFPRSGLIEKVYQYYAQATLKTGNYVESLAYFRKAKESPETLFGKAEVFHRLGLYKTAYEIYRKGIISYETYMKKHPDILYYYAENLRLMGKEDEAKPLFYLLMESNLKEKAYLSLGLIEYAKGQYDNALAYLRRAALSPDRVIKRKALLYEGEIYMKKSDLKRAKGFFLQIRKDFPYTPEQDWALVYLARIERAEGNYLNSEGYLKEILFGKKPTKEALDELDALITTLIKSGADEFERVWKECGNWLMSPDRENTLLKAGDLMYERGGDFVRVFRYLIKNGSTRAKNHALYRMGIFFGRIGNNEKLSEMIAGLEKNGGEKRLITRLKALRAINASDGESALSLLSSIEKPEKTDLDLLLQIPLHGLDPEGFVGLYRRFAAALSVAPDYELIGDYLKRKGRLTEGYKYYVLALKRNGWKGGRLLFKAAMTGGERDLIRLAASSNSNTYSEMAGALLNEMALKEKVGGLL